jgi:deoxyhypusine synthase
MSTLNLEPLELLDLSKCNTVNDIVRGMNKCSFGARMLGEVADTLEKMVQCQRKPYVVYEGSPDSQLSKLISKMTYDKHWFEGILSMSEYAALNNPFNNIVVIGRYSERYEEALDKPEQAIFINEYGLCRKNQVKDGHYPNVIFSSPNYILPLVYLVLQERLEDNRTNVISFFRELKKYDGMAKSIAEGAGVSQKMIKDKDCTIFLTLSGAMTIAKMGLIICDILGNEMVQYVASTGALMAHGLVESIGLKHYKHNPKHCDKLLARRKLNRVTDTLEPEGNFSYVDEVVDKVLKSYTKTAPLSSHKFHRMLGEYLTNHFPTERGILKSAYQKNVPVVVPAFTDSEIGNDVYTHNLWRAEQGMPKIVFDQELDTTILLEKAVSTKRIGIISIGGGVPRNNTQNLAPLIEIINGRFGEKFPERSFSYGVRICPDPMYYGHLSGCSYDEGKSWRKMNPNGKFAEIKTDATLVLPFLVKYWMEMKK